MKRPKSAMVPLIQQEEGAQAVANARFRYEIAQYTPIGRMESWSAQACLQIHSPRTSHSRTFPDRPFLDLGGADMKRYMAMAGVLCVTLAGLTAAADKPDATKGDPRAAALMDEATNTRYLWSPDVSAVSGKFAWEMEGKSGTGTFRSVLRQRGGLTVTTEGDPEIVKELKEHIGSLISHRTPPAANAAKRPTPASVIVVEDEERGPLILTVGDAMQSTQRVKDGKLVQVNRVMGDKRFTIDVAEFEKSTDGHYYPSAFTVTWWDAPSGKKTEKQTYTTQGFHVIEGQMFPKAEKVVSEKAGQASTLALQYSDVKFETGPQSAERK